VCRPGVPVFRFPSPVLHSPVCCAACDWVPVTLEGEPDRPRHKDPQTPARLQGTALATVNRLYTQWCIILYAMIILVSLFTCVLLLSSSTGNHPGWLTLQLEPTGAVWMLLLCYVSSSSKHPVTCRVCGCGTMSLSTRGRMTRLPARIL